MDLELAEATIRYVLADSREKSIRFEATQGPLTPEGFARIREAEALTEAARQELHRLYQVRLGR